MALIQYMIHLDEATHQATVTYGSSSRCPTATCATSWIAPAIVLLSFAGASQGSACDRDSRAGARCLTSVA
jgi:hypothetical protein